MPDFFLFFFFLSSSSIFFPLFFFLMPVRTSIRCDCTRIRDFQLEHLINTNVFPEVERSAAHSTAKTRTKCLRRSFEKGRGRVHAHGRTYTQAGIAEINLLAVVSEPLVPRASYSTYADSKLRFVLTYALLIVPWIRKTTAKQNPQAQLRSSRSFISHR